MSLWIQTRDHRYRQQISSDSLHTDKEIISVSFERNRRSSVSLLIQTRDHQCLFGHKQEIISTDNRSSVSLCISLWIQTRDCQCLFRYKQEIISVFLYADKRSTAIYFFLDRHTLQPQCSCFWIKADISQMNLFLDRDRLKPRTCFLDIKKEKNLSDNVVAC